LEEVGTIFEWSKKAYEQLVVVEYCYYLVFSVVVEVVIAIQQYQIFVVLVVVLEIE